MNAKLKIVLAAAGVAFATLASAEIPSKDQLFQANVTSVRAVVGPPTQHCWRATADVQKCQPIQSDAKPAFWNVTYMFEGREHTVQMTAPPGPTIQVNREGEPRS